MSAADAKVLSVSPLYKDPRGRTRDWESAERSTRPKGSDIDGVGIVAILEKPTGKESSSFHLLLLGGDILPSWTSADPGARPYCSGPEIVLQKQYRPPANQVMIEVPAGLVDEGETAEQSAVRELKEETGYVGKVTESSPLMWNDPGFCNTNLRMVHVSIDMSLPENQNLKPELEENEFIEVFYVPLKNLWEECKKLEAQGFGIDARVGTLAEGIELAKQFKL
ncbi:ADP-ribose diphosphatase [Diaporthe eres]